MLLFTNNESNQERLYDKPNPAPYVRDGINDTEYFHGDNGAGLGASHQTGWTGVIARILQMIGSISAGDALNEDWAELLAYEDTD